MMVNEPLKGALYVLYNTIAQSKKPVKASIEELAEKTGYHPSTVCMAIGDLKRMGLVRASPASGRGPFYYEVVR